MFWMSAARDVPDWGEERGLGRKWVSLNTGATVVTYNPVSRELICSPHFVAIIDFRFAGKGNDAVVKFLRTAFTI